jgi:5-methylcytosine-specific restriction protein A
MNEAKQGTRESRGYDARWRVARRRFLALNPLCVACAAAGRRIPANVVDHIRPHRGDMAAFWNSENWQALCSTCHHVKTGRGL